MMTPQHTPGPWRAHPRKDESYVISAKGVGVVAKVPRAPTLLRHERISNARLIEFAPAMLDALRAVTDAWEHRNGDLNAAMTRAVALVGRTERWTL